MVRKSKIPTVWSIGHSDSSGGTGIQADIHTFHDFEVYGCNVVTAIMAQNSFATGYWVPVERKAVVAQINALDSDLPAEAIKLGMVPNAAIMEPIARYLADFKGPVIFDLELQTSDNWLQADFDNVAATLLPNVHMLVVNCEEAAALTGLEVASPESMRQTAGRLLQTGVGGVLVTGARMPGIDGRRFDYWSDGNDQVWVDVDVVDSVNNRGGGSTLSAALAAALASGRDLKAALKIAKAYVTRGIRDANCQGSGPGSVAHHGLPEDRDDWPVLTADAPVC